MTLKSVGTMSSPTGSVFIRIALLIAITTTIVVAAFSLQSYRMVTRTAEFGVRLYGEESTSSLSQRLGGAFKFKKVEDVHDALKNQLEVAGDKALAAIALDADGTMIASVRARNGADAAALEKLAKSSLGAGDVAKSMDGFTIAHPVIFGNNGESVGTIAIAWSPESVLADLKSQMIRSFIVTAGVFLVALAAAVFYLFRSIGQPLRRVSHAIDQVAQRRYDFEVPEIGRSDEVGSIAQNLSNLKDHLAAGVEAERERRKLQIEQSTIVDALMVGLERVSKGDLTYKIDTPFSSDYEKLRQNYNSTVDTLSNMIDHVVRNSSNIRENSGAITKSSDDLSRRTENQAATLEQTAASLDMITSSVKAAAEGAVAVEKIVDETRTNAVASDEVVKRAMNAMSEIEKSSYEISQIISVIDDISFQTNLLALNAGVEAARAGEAGKGFAVVASEVRALAQKSSTSAMEINTLIQQSSDQVKAGVGLVRNAGDALAKIVEKIVHISELVSNISQGAGQQAASLAEINSGVTQLDRVTQQNAAMVEETTAASHTLSSDAQELFELVRNFKTMTGQGAGNFGGSKRLRVAG